MTGPRSIDGDAPELNLVARFKSMMRRGHDTCTIAAMLGLREAQVWNALVRHDRATAVPRLVEGAQA